MKNLELMNFLIQPPSAAIRAAGLLVLSFGDRSSATWTVGQPCVPPKEEDTRTCCDSEGTVSAQPCRKGSRHQASTERKNHRGTGYRLEAKKNSVPGTQGLDRTSEEQSNMSAASMSCKHLP